MFQFSNINLGTTNKNIRGKSNNLPFFVAVLSSKLLKKWQNLNIFRFLNIYFFLLYAYNLYKETTR